ncbi:hypothetical protein [Pontibacter liquoris]|uniref:hypothetical protein n=1 Tax=Pontibacter liquoris TaxID=2905677 RepID=UPI001FA7A656|nr:hypothetical protein [Pontibacter liquoris]
MLSEKQQENLFGKMQKAKKKWLAFIAISFLSQDLKAAYQIMLQERFSRLNL